MLKAWLIYYNSGLLIFGLGLILLKSVTLKMCPLEAVCLSTQCPNTVDVSIYRVFSVAELSSRFCQLFSSKRNYFFVWWYWPLSLGPVH